MAEKTNLLFKFRRIFIKIVLSFHIFPVNLLDVVKLFFRIWKHFRRVIKIYSKPPIRQSIPDTIFAWIINPFFNRCNRPKFLLIKLLLAGRFTDSFCHLNICLFQNSLTISPSKICIIKCSAYCGIQVFLDWCGTSFCDEEFVLTLLSCCIFACYQLIVSIHLPIITSASKLNNFLQLFLLSRDWHGCLGSKWYGWLPW